MNADGSGKYRLYRSPCCAWAWTRPAWSPDGRSLLFSLQLYDAGSKRSGVYVMSTDGARLRRVAKDASSPAWQAVG